jgi:excisionase family DNA binding protein
MLEGFVPSKCPRAMTKPLPPPPMSPKETADYLGVSMAVVYRLVRSGRLRAAKIGGQYRITQTAVRQLLEEK